MADKPQTYCPPFDFTQGGEQVEPRLEGLVPWFLNNGSCLDTHELLNNSLAFKSREIPESS